MLSLELGNSPLFVFIGTVTFLLLLLFYKIRKISKPLRSLQFWLLWGLITIFIIVLTTMMAVSYLQDTLSNNVTPEESGPTDSIYVLDTTISLKFQGDTNQRINETIKMFKAFDKQSQNFKRDTFIVYENTTEGCEIICIYGKSVNFMRFDGTLYGEMGKREFKYYLIREPTLKAYLVWFKDVFYDKPMYQKDIRFREAILTYLIIADNKLIGVLDEKLIRKKVSQSKMKELETDARKFFKEYIGQIKLIK